MEASGPLERVVDGHHRISDRPRERVPITDQQSPGGQDDAIPLIEQVNRAVERDRALVEPMSDPLNRARVAPYSQQRASLLVPEVRLGQLGPLGRNGLEDPMVEPRRIYSIGETNPLSMGGREGQIPIANEEPALRRGQLVPAPAGN